MRENYAITELEISGEFPTQCEWYKNCTNTPTHIVSHPILQWVPSCERCKELAAN